LRFPYALSSRACLGKRPSFSYGTCGMKKDRQVLVSTCNRWARLIRWSRRPPRVGAAAVGCEVLPLPRVRQPCLVMRAERLRV
jgi:hypothetical protein